MTPTPNLRPEIIGVWLRDLAGHAVDPDEIEMLTSDELPRSRFRQNVEATLNLGADGIPVWWPGRDPDSRQKLSPAVRRQWCLQFFADQWSPDQEILRAASDTLRRRMLSLHLIHTHSEISAGELPGPDRTNEVSEGRRLVSREEAATIAEEYLSYHESGSRRIRKVCALDEVSAVPTLYNGPDLSTCWIAYVATPMRGLQSSTIVLVSRHTGDVLYAGSAHDEG